MGDRKHFDGEIEPGTFRDGGRGGSQEDINRLMGIGKKRDILTGAKLDRYLPSEELKRAFTNITAATTNREAATEHKKELISEVLERGLIPTDLLQHYPAVYIGSGTDVEYPLCLGARQIEMVDLELQNSSMAEEVKHRIKDVIGGQPHQLSEGSFSFSMDFGQGPETTTVNLRPCLYRSNYGPREERKPYIPPREISLVLGFNSGVELDSDPNLFANLAKGGMVLSNRSLESVIARATDQELMDMIQDVNYALSWLKQTYSDLGYEFITLNAEKDTYHYTVLKKIAEGK